MSTPSPSERTMLINPVPFQHTCIPCSMCVVKEMWHKDMTIFTEAPAERSLSVVHAQWHEAALARAG